MKVSLKIIQTNLKQRIPSLYIQTRSNTLKSKYIINAPSSLQRFLPEHQIKLTPDIVYLFTKSCTQTISGLTGLMYMVSEIYKLPAKSKLYVDKNLFQYLEEVRYKMGFNMTYFSYNSWEGNLRRGLSNSETINKIRTSRNLVQNFNRSQQLITQQYSKSQQNDAGQYYDSKNKQYKDENIKIIPIQIDSNKQIITHFIFQVQDCQATVKQADNLPSFLILHFDSIETISKTLSNSIFKEYHLSSNRNISCIVYIVEQPSIVVSEQFKTLVSLFPALTQQILFNRSFKNRSDSMKQIFKYHRYVKIISKLSQIYPTCLPNIFATHQEIAEQHYKQMIDIEDHFSTTNIQTYKHNYEMNLYPLTNIKYASISNRMMEATQFSSLLPRLPTLQDDAKIRDILKKCDPKVIFLGTACQHANELKNVSCIIIEIQNFLCMFDCGQGSYDQFYTHYARQTDEKLLQTRILFISHCHSDHTLGIMDIISQRNKLMRTTGRRDKVYLIVPSNMIPWIQRYCEIIEDIRDGFEIVFIETLKEGGDTVSLQTLQKQMKQENGSANCKGRLKQQNPSSKQYQKPEAIMEDHYSFQGQLQFYVLLFQFINLNGAQL